MILAPHLSIFGVIIKKLLKVKVPWVVQILDYPYKYFKVTFLELFYVIFINTSKCSYKTPFFVLQTFLYPKLLTLNTIVCQ